VNVTVVGLGRMGSALADALIAQGFDVTVWNRTPAKVVRYAEAGVRVTSTVAEAARVADALVVCVFDDRALRDAVMTAEVAAALGGKSLIHLTSTTNDVLAEVLAWCRRHDIALVKGLIVVHPDAIRAGDGTVIYGGARPAFDACLPVLDAMGGRSVFMTEDPMAVSSITTAFACVLYPLVMGFVEGAALCRRIGTPLDSFARDLILPYLRGPGLAAMVGDVASACAHRRDDGDVQGTLAAWDDALRTHLADAADLGAEANLLATVKALFERGLAAGHGERDLGAVFEALVNAHDETGRSTIPARGDKC
jgi:3-hydroxyisobutyrate dehydrogenase-like beta-hydroxyacid dehydrogenase